jgi:hypothetical protein
MTVSFFGALPKSFDQKHANQTCEKWNSNPFFTCHLFLIVPTGKGALNCDLFFVED